MNVPSYAQLLAENERLREEGRKDYEGMREFQQKYIAADQELRKLRAELDALRKEADKFSDGVDWIQRAMQAEADLDALNGQVPVAWECRGDIYRVPQRYIDTNRLIPGQVPLYARPIPAQSVRDEFREGAEAAARLIDQKAELYATRFGHDNTGGISFGQGPHAESKMDHYTGLLELADELRAALAAAPKPEVK